MIETSVDPSTFRSYKRNAAKNQNMTPEELCTGITKELVPQMNAMIKMINLMDDGPSIKKADVKDVTKTCVDAVTMLDGKIDAAKITCGPSGLKIGNEKALVKAMEGACMIPDDADDDMTGIISLPACMGAVSARVIHHDSVVECATKDKEGFMQAMNEIAPVLGAGLARSMDFLGKKT